jgi:hypothetical protein
VLFFVLASCFACTEIDTWPAEKFDSKKWKQSPEHLRYVFVKDIIKSKLLINKTKDDVIEMLGLPNSEVKQPLMLEYIVKTEGKSFSQVFFLEFGFEVTNTYVKYVDIRTD